MSLSRGGAGAKFAQHGLSPAGGTPAEFQCTIATDLKNWTETAGAANMPQAVCAPSYQPYGL